MIENNEKQKIILPQYILITLYTFTCVLQIAMFVYLHIFKYSIQRTDFNLIKLLLWNRYKLGIYDYFYNFMELELSASHRQLLWAPPACWERLRDLSAETSQI